MMLLQRLRECFNRWWQGERLPDRPFILELPRYRRRWTARMVRAVRDFYLRHWQALWSLATGLAAVVVAYLALKK